MASDFNPPTYYVLAHISLLLFNGWDVAIRFPALIAGILLVPAMYLLGSEYNRDYVEASRLRAGVVCSGLTSILFPLVYYSQYARAYSLSILCFVIALIFFIRAWRGVDGGTWWFFVMFGINMWVHLFSAIPLALLAIALFIRRPNALHLSWVPLMICLPLIGMLASVGSARAIGPGMDYGYPWYMVALITPGEFFGVLFVIIFLLAVGWMYVQREHLTRSLAFVVPTTIFIGLILSNFTPLFPRYYLTVSLIVLLFAGCMLTSIILAIWDLLETSSVRFNLPEGAIIIIIIAVVAVLLALQYGDFVNFYTVQKYICT
jgi:uncharacterized membrane protein